MPARKKTRSTKAVSSSSVVEVPQNLEQKRKYIIIGAVVVLVLALLYSLRSFFIAAIVNGQPISRLSVISQMEKQSGKQTLDALVTENLIRQEIKKQSVTVDPKDVNAEILKIEQTLASQQQSLDSALSVQGMTKTDLIKQITLQKQLEKLLLKNIKVTDEEIDKFIEQNEDYLASASTSSDLKTEAKQQLLQQKIGQKYQGWIEDLKKKAKITYFLNY